MPDEEDRFSVLAGTALGVEELADIGRRLEARGICHFVVRDPHFGRSFWGTWIGKVIYVVMGLATATSPTLDYPKAYVWVEPEFEKRAKEVIAEHSGCPWP